VVEVRCKLYREKLGWRRERLAVEAGVGWKTIQRIEQGKGLRTLQLQTLVTIAHAMGCSACDLVPALHARPGRKPTVSTSLRPKGE
jgi:DNA-binding XRE family transcriptional regulator